MDKQNEVVRERGNKRDTNASKIAFEELLESCFGKRNAQVLSHPLGVPET
jgi:hypothetical protein